MVAALARDVVRSCYASSDGLPGPRRDRNEARVAAGARELAVMCDGVSSDRRYLAVLLADPGAHERVQGRDLDLEDGVMVLDELGLVHQDEHADRDAGMLPRV